MFIILVYDVNAKRVGKIGKICRKYLKRVQRSVYEGDVTPKQLTTLQKELERVIVSEEDAICIYQFDSIRYAQKSRIGIMDEFDNIL